MQTSTITAPQCLQNITSSFAAIGGFTPSVSAIVSSIVLANKTSSTVNVSVTLYNGTTDYYLAYSAPVAANDSLIVGGPLAKFMLVNGWYIRVACATANAVDASMCVLSAS